MYSKLADVKFPSPVGELHFSIVYRFWIHWKSGFPSPVGELHFSMFTKPERRYYEIFIVSVPCRGTTFLNKIWNHFTDRWIIVSVPCRGTTFLNKKQYTIIKSSGKFPSPVGELHFSISPRNVISCYVSVSVPCRGTTFLKKDLLPVEDFGNEFPSPVGELHFSNKTTVSAEGNIKSSFRPLSGNYISQRKDINVSKC